ncbi:MAG: hypothetical protein ACAI38_18360 [Myxococcota bacterium]
MELAASGPRVGTICTCGTEITYPEVYNTGVRPNERAAERLRYRAFRAAGLVKNIGGFALGLALLGIIFFPLALIGAIVGIYVLTMVRGPLGRYSGRQHAMIAIGVGTLVFVAEGSVLWSFLAQRRAERLSALQASGADDLRTLLRTERLYRAAQDRFGTLKESHFQPRIGAYTIYLSPDEYVSAMRDEQAVTDPLPADLWPRVTNDAFTAVAVANLDSDADLDVWVVSEAGEVKHVANDVPWLPEPKELTRAEPTIEAASPAGEGPAVVVPIMPPVPPPQDKGKAEKAAAEKTAAEKAAAEKAAAEKAAAEKAAAEKAAAEKAAAGKPGAEKPASDKATTDKPTAEKPSPDKPAAE